jgi:methylglutaconyl-CoA hydratase
MSSRRSGRAGRIGLIDRVVTDAAALEQAQADLAAQIMTCGPNAVAEAKALVAHVAEHPIDHAVMAETAKRIARVRVSEEGREGIAAFLEKRKPGWAE